jgi:hypothetical protein
VTIKAAAQGHPLLPLDTSSQAGIGPLNYDELPGLEDVYLEDSFVRDIESTPSLLRFVLVAALTPAHPAYERPSPREQHCFRTAFLTFPDVRKTIWHARNEAALYTDLAGAIDRGNIDRFTAEPDGHYHLEGDWGSVDVVSGAPLFELAAREAHARAHKREDLEAWITGVKKPHGHEH